MSIVADGPAQMLEVVRWFSRSPDSCATSLVSVSGNSGTRLQVVRIKNLFGLQREEVHDGYRDLKLFLAFTNPKGLGIIGEIQVRFGLAFHF